MVSHTVNEYECEKTKLLKLLFGSIYHDKMSCSEVYSYMKIDRNASHLKEVAGSSTVWKTMEMALFPPIPQTISLTLISRLSFLSISVLWKDMLSHVIFKVHFRSKIEHRTLIFSQLFSAYANYGLIAYSTFVGSSKKTSWKVIKMEFDDWVHDF